jgi:hypothetical protein
MDTESLALHARARAFVRAYESGAPMPETFDQLACDLARFQASRVPGYANLCRARGVDPKTITSASEAPAVPVDAFKLARVATFPEALADAVTFRTSGTTLGTRGVHAMRDTATYDAAALAFGRWALQAFAREPVFVLGPSPREAPDSSLSHMNGLFSRAFGTPATEDETYFIKDDILDVALLDERIARIMAQGHESALVLATSFALVHLLEALGGAPFRFPPKTRVMQTGGFKGKSREVAAPELRRDLASAFKIDARAIIGEYGMTELSSQFYEATVASPEAERWIYLEPPWARVVPVDPVTLEPVLHGQVGIARIEDLMNVDSAFAVLAADRVRRKGPGFELLGRAEGAPPRGCSIAIDEILGK